MTHSFDRTKLTQQLGFQDKDKKNPRHDFACQYLCQTETHHNLVKSIFNTLSKNKVIIEKFKQLPELQKVEVLKEIYYTLHLNRYPQPLYEPHAVAKSLESLEKITNSKIISSNCFEKNGETYRPVECHSVESQILIENSIDYQILECSTLQTTTELPISKGVGQYKTSIGFLDVTLPFKIEFLIEYQQELKQQKVYVKNDNVSGGGHYINYELQKPILQKSKTKTKQIGILPIEVKITPVGVGDIIRQIEFYREYIKFLEIKGRQYDNLYISNLSRYTIDYEIWCVVTDFDLTESDVEQLRKHQILHFKLGEKFEEFILINSKKISQSQVV